MQITFLTLELTNYRKLDHFYLAMQNRGIVRVEGANGAGKSSIFEGLAWVLFGQDSRNSSIKSIIKFGETKVAGKVQLEIKGIRYTIGRERTASNTKVTLFDNDEEIVFNTSKDAQLYIENLLGIDINTFYRLVFLRQYNFNSFFELTDSNQKGFFDAIFDFSIFNTLYEYYDNIVKKMKSIENEFSQVYNWLSSEKATLEQENKRLLGLSVDEISADTEDTKIQELENRAEMCKKELTNLTSEKSKLGKTLTAQESIIKELEKSIKQFKEKEKFFPEKVDLYRASLEEGKCIVCNRKLSQTLEQKFTKILTELDSLQSDLKTMNDNLTKERDEYENINTQLYNIIDRMNSLKFNKESFELKIKNIHNTIEQNIKQKENIKKLIESRDNIISANINRISDISSVLDDDMLNNFVSYKKNLETIKDLFGKKGIKNNFIEVYVTALSEHINTILSNILDNTTVKISTEKHLSTGELTRAIDISIIKNDNVLGYFDLSGGERKRLDLAFTLALHTLLEEIGDFSSNILILDEAFDGLDAEGMERFSNYLRGYDKNSIFLITHTPYTTYADNLIVMGEDNG